MNGPLVEIPRNPKNGKFVASAPEDCMARKPYPGGWHIWKKKGAKEKPWIAEHGYGAYRKRPGFYKEQEAIDFVTLSYRLSRDKDKPFLSIPPGDSRWSVLQTVAEELSKVEADSTDAAEWQSLATAKRSTRKTLHLMKPRIDYCLDRHKPEFMVTAVFDKLSSTQSSFTVKQMVDSRRNAKEKKNGRLKTERQRKRSKGNTDQVFQVGDSLIERFGAETDIDSISTKDMEGWAAWYIVTFKKNDGSQIAESTMEGRKGIAEGYFNHVRGLGWPGVSPVKKEKVPNAKPTVILNFHEVSGIIIALRYINPRACLAFVIELYGLLRGTESLWVRRENIVLPDCLLQVTFPKLTSDHSKRSNTDVSMERVQIIDALYQWICYLSELIGDYDHVWPQVKTKDEGKGAFQRVMLMARKKAKCKRWNHKDNGRHTGGSAAWVLGVALEDIREQMRHAFGSLVTRESYLRDMKHRDAAAILLITPANLGWIAAAYAYKAPTRQPNHLGHQLWLDGERPDHRSIMEEYIPKLKARDAEIRAALHID